MNLITDKNKLINQYRTYTQQSEFDKSKISNNQPRRVSENFPHHTAAIGSQKSHSTSRSRSMQEDDLSRSQDTSKKSNQQQFLNQTINDTQSNQKDNQQLSYDYQNEYLTQNNNILKESHQQNRQIEIPQNESYTDQVFNYDIEPHQFKMSQLLDGRMSLISKETPSKNNSIDASGIKRKADENITQSENFNTIVFNQEPSASLTVQRAPRYKNSQADKQKQVKKTAKQDQTYKVMKTFPSNRKNYDSVDHLKSSYQKSLESSATRKSQNTMNSNRNSKQTVSSTKQISCQSRKIIEERSSQKYLGLQPILKSKRYDTNSSFQTIQMRQTDQINREMDRIDIQKQEMNSSSKQNTHSTFNHTYQINDGQFIDFNQIQPVSSSKESIKFNNLISDSSECIRQQNGIETFSPCVKKDFSNLRSPHFAQNSKTDLKLQDTVSSEEQKLKVYLNQPQNKNVYSQPQQVYRNIITIQSHPQQDQFVNSNNSQYHQYYQNSKNQLNCDIDCLTPQTQDRKPINFIKSNLPHPEFLKQDLIQYSNANNKDQYNSMDPKLSYILGGCTINSDPKRANTIEIQSSSNGQSMQNESSDEEEEEEEDEEQEEQEESQTERNMTQMLQQIYQPVIVQQKYVVNEIQDQQNSNLQTKRSIEQQNQDEFVPQYHYVYEQPQNNFQNYGIPYNPNEINNFKEYMQINTIQGQNNVLSMNNLQDYNNQTNNCFRQGYDTQLPQINQYSDQIQFYQSNQPFAYDSVQQNYTKKSDIGVQVTSSRNSISSIKNENFVKKRVKMPKSNKKRSKSLEPTKRQKQHQKSASIKSQDDCVPRNIVLSQIKRNSAMSEEEVIQVKTHSIKRGRVVKKAKSQFPSVRIQKSLNQNASASRTSLGGSACNQRAKSLPKNLAKLLFKPISDVRQILQHLQLGRHSHILTDKGLTHISQLLLLDEEALKQLQIPKHARIFILSYTRQYKKYLKKKFQNSAKKSVKSDSNTNRTRIGSLNKYVSYQQTERQQKSQPKIQICKFIDQVAKQKLSEEQVFRKIQIIKTQKQLQKQENISQKSVIKNEDSQKQKKSKKTLQKQKTPEKTLCKNCKKTLSPSSKSNDICSPYNILKKITQSNSVKSGKFCICNSGQVLPSTLDIGSEQFYNNTTDNMIAKKQLSDMMIQAKQDRVNQLLTELGGLIGQPIKIEETPMFSALTTQQQSPVHRLQEELNQVHMHRKSFQFQNENRHMNKNSISMKDIVTLQNTFCNQDLQFHDAKLSNPQISRNTNHDKKLSETSDEQQTRGRKSSGDSNQFLNYNQSKFQNQIIQTSLNNKILDRRELTSPSFQSVNHFSHMTSQVQSRDDPLYNVDQSRYNADKSLQFQQTCQLNNNQNINNFNGTQSSYDVDMQHLMGSFQSQNDYKKFDAQHKKFLPKGTNKSFLQDFQQTDNSQGQNFNNYDLMPLYRQNNFFNPQKFQPDSTSQSYLQDNFFNAQKYQPDSTLTEKHNPFSPPQTNTQSQLQSTSRSRPNYDLHNPTKQHIPYKQQTILPSKYYQRTPVENQNIYQHDIKYLHKPENPLVPYKTLSYKNEQILGEIQIADSKYKQACEQIKLFHQKLSQVQQRMKII